MPTSIPPPLIRTEDAVETLGGLISILSYVHDVADTEDARALKSPVGHLLNTMHREVGRARSGYEGVYRCYRRITRENTG